MFPALFVCFFGAALAAACDPTDIPVSPGILGPSGLKAGDDLSVPGACSEAKTEQACQSALTCVWANDRCSALDIAGAP